MRTTLFEVELKNGAIYRIFCANINQISRFRGKLNSLKSKGLVESSKEIANGIHTVKQWDEIVKNL